MPSSQASTSPCAAFVHAPWVDGRYPFSSSRLHSWASRLSLRRPHGLSAEPCFAHGFTAAVESDRKAVRTTKRNCEELFICPNLHRWRDHIFHFSTLSDLLHRVAGCRLFQREHIRSRSS